MVYRLCAFWQVSISGVVGVVVFDVFVVSVVVVFFVGGVVFFVVVAKNPSFVDRVFYCFAS